VNLCIYTHTYIIWYTHVFTYMNSHTNMCLRTYCHVSCMHYGKECLWMRGGERVRESPSVQNYTSCFRIMGSDICEWGTETECVQKRVSVQKWISVYRNPFFYRKTFLFTLSFSSSFTDIPFHNAEAARVVLDSGRLNISKIRPPPPYY